MIRAVNKKAAEIKEGADEEEKKDERSLTTFPQRSVFGLLGVGLLS